MRVRRCLPIIVTFIALTFGTSPRAADAVTTPVLEQQFAAAIVGGELSLTGAGFGDVGSGREVLFSYGGAVHAISSTDALVVAWNDASVTVIIPTSVRTGTVAIRVDGATSPAIDLVVYEFFSYPLPQGPGGGQHPLALDVDSTGRAWVLEEYHTDLKWVRPPSPTEPAATGMIPIPAPTTGKLFAVEAFGGMWGASNRSMLGEDIDIAADDTVWFTQGGGLFYEGGMRNSSRIVRYTPASGQFACFPVPIDDGELIAVLVDPARDRIWYTLSDGGANAIGHFDPALTPNDCAWSPASPFPAPLCDGPVTIGCHSLMSIAPGGHGPSHLIMSADGIIWFAESLSSSVGRLDPESGGLTRFPLPAPTSGNAAGSLPWELQISPTGELWVTEYFDAAVIKFDTTSLPLAACTSLSVEGRNPCMTEVMHLGAAGSNQQIHTLSLGRRSGWAWFTEREGVGIIAPGLGDAVVRLAITGYTRDFAGIVEDPATGDVWVAQFADRRLGLLREASGDADGVHDSIDNCPGLYNPGQENADDDRIDLAEFGRPFFDLTWPLHDSVGDLCDNDADNDGLSNDRELRLPDAGCPSASGPTSPILRDTDGDLALDGPECALGTDPASPASAPTRFPPGDADRDGLTPLLELLLGTDPEDPDTDGDGVLDGVEFRAFGSDPAAINSDNDDCSDAKEVASLNSDRRVTSGDQLLLAMSYGRAGTPAYAFVFDVNRDSAINSADLLFMAQQYGSC